VVELEEERVVGLVGEQRLVVVVVVELVVVGKLVGEEEVNNKL